MSKELNALLEQYRGATRERMEVEAEVRKWEDERTRRGAERTGAERALIDGELRKASEGLEAANARIREIEKKLRDLIEQEQAQPVEKAFQDADRILKDAAEKVQPRIEEVITWAVTELGARVETRLGRVTITLPEWVKALRPDSLREPETAPKGSPREAYNRFFTARANRNSFDTRAVLESILRGEEPASA